MELEHVAFVVDGLAVLVGLAGFKLDRLAANGAAWEQRL